MDQAIPATLLSVDNDALAFGPDDRLQITDESGAPIQEVDEGATATLAATFNDPNEGDTHTATIDWGDGSRVVEASVDQATDTVSGDHVYADNGVYTVKLRITDDSGALLAARIDLTVLNADPVLDPLPEVSTNEGGRFNLDADFNDPGTLDTHTATIDWGDGTPTEDATIDETPFGPPGSTEGLDGTVSGTHVYGDNGTYTVTVSIEDDDSGQDSGTFAVTVNNVAPLVDAGPHGSLPCRKGKPRWR